MDMIRIGVIGVGQMGAFHARTISGFAGVELVAVADPADATREQLAAELGCASHAEPADLLDHDLDGVVIASPDDTHAELTLAALARERFVLCEKPLAGSLADAERIVDAEDVLGRRLVQVGFMREYDLAHRQLVDELAACGRIEHVRAVHRNAPSPGGVRPIDRIVRQSMVHDIHSVRFVTGAEITEVTAFGSGPDDDSFRYVVAVCRLDSGAHAVVEFDDRGFAYEVSVEVMGARADAVTGGPTSAITRGGGSIEVHIGVDWFVRFGEAYAVQDRAWVDSIRAGTATGPTARDGCSAEAVVVAILRSLDEHRTVVVDQVRDPA